MTSLAESPRQSPKLPVYSAGRLSSLRYNAEPSADWYVIVCTSSARDCGRIVRVVRRREKADMADGVGRRIMMGIIVD